MADNWTDNNNNDNKVLLILLLVFAMVDKDRCESGFSSKIRQGEDKRGQALTRVGQQFHKCKSSKRETKQKHT